jgi:hypothetical protein
MLSEDWASRTRSSTAVEASVAPSPVPLSETGKGTTSVLPQAVAQERTRLHPHPASANLASAAYRFRCEKWDRNLKAALDPSLSENANGLGTAEAVAKNR